MDEIKEQVRLSPHLQYVLTTLGEPRFAKYLSPADSAVITRIVTAMQKSPDAASVNTELLVAGRLYLSSATLAAKYRGLQEASKDQVDSVEAHCAVTFRAAVEQRGEKATDKRIEYEVEQAADVLQAKQNVVVYSELTDVMFSLRECARMRHETLMQIANNLRAEMKLEARS